MFCVPKRTQKVKCSVLVEVVLILEYARNFWHYKVCLRLWHRLAKGFDVLGLRLEFRRRFFSHIEEVLIKLIISLLWSTLLKCTRLSSASKVRQALWSSRAIELKFLCVSCSRKIARNRFVLWLNSCLLLLEVLVCRVLHFPNLWLIEVVVVVIILHLFDILISKVLWILLLWRLSMWLMSILILCFYVNILILCLDLWVCLVILMICVWLANVRIVRRLLEIFSLTSVFLTLGSSSDVEQILFVMFISPYVVLLFWLN
jgi:hypothetical protein